MFPAAQRMNRGNHEIATLVRACKANNVTDLVIIHETRGQPGWFIHSSKFNVTDVVEKFKDRFPKRYI